MSRPEDTVRLYLDTWNATDAGERSRLLGRLWADDGRYADPLASVEGRGGLDQLIAAVQQRFAGLRFAPWGRVDAHGAHLRFSWALQDAQGGVVARGTDVATLAADGRMQSVIGFIDQAPAA